MVIADVSRQRLRGHRNGTGLSPAEVAERIGCAESDVRAWEAGELSPAPVTLRVLAQLYACPEDGFVRRRDGDAADYIDAVVSHMAPLGDDDLRSVASVLRRIGARQGATSGNCGSTSGDAAPKFVHDTPCNEKSG